MQPIRETFNTEKKASREKKNQTKEIITKIVLKDFLNIQLFLLLPNAQHIKGHKKQGGGTINTRLKYTHPWLKAFWC